MRQEIDKSLIDSIKQKIIDKLYLKNGHEDIIKNMENIKHVYVEDLKTTENCSMISRTDNIAVDLSFCIFDKDGKFVEFDPKVAKLIESQIGHEILHTASRNLAYSGNLGYINDDSGRGLNEGVTQMITENVFGYVVNPFSDKRYKDFKKMAKIITNTIGYKNVLHTYFYHENNMKDSCNKLAGNNAFYDDFNKQLTGIYYLTKLSKKTSDNTQLKIIREQRINLAYKSLIVNIVIPHLKTLNEEEKYNYIKNIIRDINDDRTMSHEIVDILKNTINKSDEELKQIKEQLSKKEKSLYKRQEFVEELEKTPEKALKKIFVDQTGKVTYKYDNKIINIKNEDLLCKIYEALYDNTPKHQMYDYDIENLKTKIKNGEEISLNTGNVLKRKIWLAKIKSIMSKEDIVILNNFSELNTTHKIVPKSISTKKGILEYQDLRKIAEAYKLNHDNNIITVINRSSNLEVSDPKLSAYAIFANFWLDNAKTYDDNNKEIPGIDSAYNFTNRLIYNDIIEIMKNNMTDTGKLNMEDLNKYAIKNPSAKKIIDSIFRNPKTYEVVYTYMMKIKEQRKLLPEKEITIIEQNNTNYNEEYIDRVTKSILSK